MSLKNIIFDFGGVICNIDISVTEKAFNKLGLRKFDNSYSVTERETFFSHFESGQITPAQFRETLRKYMAPGVTDAEIDRAWNALLLDLPESRIVLLQKLRKKYRLFLISNTNQIHYEHYLRDLQDRYGCRDFSDLFERVYFSHLIGLKKPSREVFDYVLSDAGILPGETLFIDDSIQHIEGARKSGLRVYHLKNGEDITTLFNPEMRFLP